MFRDRKFIVYVYTLSKKQHNVLSFFLLKDLNFFLTILILKKQKCPIPFYSNYCIVNIVK